MLFITNKASNINQGLGCGGETDQNPQKWKKLKKCLISLRSMHSSPS